jgi:outer membrane protein TolC
METVKQSPMKNKFKGTFFFTVLMSVFSVAYGDADSVNVMSYEKFLERVLEHHPMLYQAELKIREGEATVLKARGGFDPKLSSSMNEKDFESIDYYSHVDAGLKIPTWFGLNASTGYKLNDGIYMNPSDRTPDAGLWYAGLNIELGNGLFIDQRRASLQKAKLTRESTLQERVVIKNELLYKASVSYWNWAQFHFQLSVLADAVRNAEIRRESVVQSVRFGDRPAIDTVEVMIQVQNRMYMYNEMLTEVLNAKNKLELYLWDRGFVPLEIDNLIPEAINSLERMPFEGIQVSELEGAVQSHPYLFISKIKLDQSNIDLKYKKEQLKPDISLGYQALAPSNSQGYPGTFEGNNFIWTGRLAYPVFTRKQRGEVRLQEIKIEQQELELSMTQAEIKQNIANASNKVVLYKQQLDLYEETLSNYERLYESEKQLFEMGESSLFMINSREKSFLEAQLKMLELEALYQITIQAYQYALMQ